MTSPDVEERQEQRMVAQIAALHIARKQESEGRAANRTLTERFRTYLEAMPEGERELWDGEREIGVALKDRGGRRWVEWTALPDEVIVWAVSAGLLDGLNVGMLDALKQTTDREVQHMLAQLTVRQEEQPTIVLLPERGRRQND